MEVLGWRAVPNTDIGGFDIHCPGSYDTYRGWAKTEETAMEMLNERSGYNYSQLPVVKYSELKFDKQSRVKLFGGWYEHTVISLNDKELGRFQTKRQNKRETCLTVFNNSCVQGHDIRWLLEQNGYRYENDLGNIV